MRGILGTVATLAMLIFSAFADAARLAVLPPLEIASNQYNKDINGENPQGSHGAITYSLSNLSDIAQTVTVRMKAIGVHNTMCVHGSSPVASGGWSGSSGTCVSNDQTVADLTQTVTLAAHQSAKQRWVIICNWAPSGPTCTAGGTRTNYNWNLGSTGVKVSFASEISVAEDRGAVVASVFGEGFLWLGYAQVAPYLNSLINGGRPF